MPNTYGILFSTRYSVIRSAPFIRGIVFPRASYRGLIQARAPLRRKRKRFNAVIPTLRLRALPARLEHLPPAIRCRAQRRIEREHLKDLLVDALALALARRLVHARLEGDAGRAMAHQHAVADLH